jgi:hypothetical protein
MQIAHVHAYTEKGAEQKHDAQRMEHEQEATLIG